MYLLVLAGIITAGRLYVKAHTLNEILLGSFVGFLVLYVSVKFGVFI
jgi:membrane-associated phospholipid phosphatase